MLEERERDERSRLRHVLRRRKDASLTPSSRAHRVQTDPVGDQVLTLTLTKGRRQRKPEGRSPAQSAAKPKRQSAWVRQGGLRVGVGGRCKLNRHCRRYFSSPLPGTKLISSRIPSGSSNRIE